MVFMDSEFYLIVCTVFLFILAFGLVSNLTKEKLYLPETIISITFGILVGKYGLKIINTGYTDSKIIMYQFSRVVLCIQVMTVAMSLPHGYIYGHCFSLLILIFLVSLLKYFISFCIVYMFSHYNVAVSLGIAACLTPTDPILSSSILKSKFADENVPERLRLLLSAESGINDGIGLALLYFPIDVLYSDSLYTGIYTFVTSTLLYKCLFPALLGALIGYLSRISLQYCYARGMVGIESFLVYGLALTFFILGLMAVLEASELICIFFTGTVFSWDEWFVLETRESRLQEITDSIFTSSFFVFFGSRIDFSKLSWKILLAALLILTLRRMLPCLLCYPLIPDVHSLREAAFIGWFGPIGVGALFYSLQMDQLLGTLTIDFVTPIVLASVFIHGLTIPIINLMRNKIESDELSHIVPILK
ncbi:Na(+)/H(+) antiporter 1 [Astathelohania contejeani]|uniref:Na(+)/H(+) antiporter 1 n=1 Tax=Astathelohania contejeani TaxID=164912 RepID=A0ABQ7I2A6_9MICR|nr:Na(+)/H(+) antiporter 1 [Thelohania contejeani]